MNISGPAAVAKPEMLFYAPGDLTVTDNVSAYIAEHLNEPMLKDELKAALIRVLNIVPAKGRSSQETIGKLLLNRELQKYRVEIITTRETAGKWRFKTVWMLVELK